MLSITATPNHCPFYWEGFRLRIVVISFQKTEGKIQINYSDNGIGTSNQIILKNGLLNAENRLAAINGTLAFDTASGKGFKASLVFPV